MQLLRGIHFLDITNVLIQGANFVYENGIVKFSGPIRMRSLNVTAVWMFLSFLCTREKPWLDNDKRGKGQGPQKH